MREKNSNINRLIAAMMVALLLMARAAAPVVPYVNDKLPDTIAGLYGEIKPASDSSSFALLPESPRIVHNFSDGASVNGFGCGFNLIAAISGYSCSLSKSRFGRAPAQAGKELVLSYQLSKEFFIYRLREIII